MDTGENPWIEIILDGTRIVFRRDENSFSTGREFPLDRSETIFRWSGIFSRRAGIPPTGRSSARGKLIVAYEGEVEGVCGCLWVSLLWGLRGSAGYVL